jgi:hypothetical protein
MQSRSIHPIRHKQDSEEPRFSGHVVTAHGAASVQDVPLERASSRWWRAQQSRMYRNLGALAGIPSIVPQRRCPDARAAMINAKS